jgi:hypothetical protein
MVPWDTYMPRDAPRYFGTPDEYADLYGFIRASRDLLDGYEDAAAIGPGLADDRWAQAAPLAIRGGSGRVRAFVRARPGEPTAPVAVHLVEWGEPQPLSIVLENAHFFGGEPAVRLLVPPGYDRSAHNAAEQRGDYSGLARTVDLAARVEGPETVVEIPPLAPWGILVVSAGK